MDKATHILYLEDDANEAELIRKAVTENIQASTLDVVATRENYLSAIQRGEVDIILSDSRVPGFDGLSALRAAREQCPDVPFICVSSYVDRAGLDRLKAAGITAFASKTDLPQLVATIQQAIGQEQDMSNQQQALSTASERLIAAVQELSLARDLKTIMAIVRVAARELTGADGATFVLRDGELCHYVDEDAIAPLWKGKRFPMQNCVSGWAMLHGRSVLIDDIYADERIPADIYRPTFVKSLAIVPIRPSAPFGAIGNYWAQHHHATAQEMKLLQALADSTCIAMENLRLYEELEQRVSDRTAQLEAANKELEAFSYAVSHDLRAPLRHIQGFSNLLSEDWSEQIGAEGQDYLHRLNRAAQHMERLIDDLLALSRMAQVPVRREQVNLSAIAQEIAVELQALALQRKINFVFAEDIVVLGDPGLLHVVMQNLLSNAWKFTSRRPRARIEFGSAESPSDGTYYYVRDNGMGFDMAYAGKLFTPFQRLHSDAEVPGTGIGLATVQRIVRKHGGRIWADAKPDQGAGFYFTL